MADVQLRKYTIYRIYDVRIDPKPKGGEDHTVIFEFSGTPEQAKEYGERQRLDAWILDANLEWHRKDRGYWKEIFKRAGAETFIPGTGVYEPRYDGRPQQERDEVSQYWKRLCWRGGLPIGEFDIWDSSVSGLPLDHPKAYWGPQSTAQWIRVLRFWIRTEQCVLDSGVRRTLDDYPPKVKQGLSIAINLMTKDLDCVDNIRFAQTRKPGEMRRFRRTARSGCCGSAERYVIIGTQQYIIGCNYGH